MNRSDPSDGPEQRHRPTPAHELSQPGLPRPSPAEGADRHPGATRSAEGLQPRLSACVVLLRNADQPLSLAAALAAGGLAGDDRLGWQLRAQKVPKASSLQVLMVQRHQRSPVLANAWVFPGGKLEKGDWPEGMVCTDTDQGRDQDQDQGQNKDHDPGSGSNLRRPSAVDRSHPSSSPDEFDGPWAGDAELARAHRRAALRETREEAGVDLSDQRLIPWQRWITPLQPTVMNRRFDTRFYLAALPDAARVQPDPHELQAHRWVNPLLALATWWAGDMVLAPAQVMSLTQLLWHPNLGDALSHAATQRPAWIEPETVAIDGGRWLVYPGHPAHSRPHRVISGPLALQILPEGRFEPADGFAGLFER